MEPLGREMKKTITIVFVLSVAATLAFPAAAQSVGQKNELKLHHPMPVWVDKPSSATKLNLKKYEGKKVFAGYREFEHKECEAEDHQFARYYKCKSKKIREPLKVEWLFSVPHSSINTSPATNMSLQKSAAGAPPSPRKSRKNKRKK